MPNPLWPLRRQGPNRWLRWGASFVCLAQFLVIVVVVVKACFETEGGCHWYSFLRTAFVAHKFRSMSLDQAASEIVVLPPPKEFDAGNAGFIHHWHQLPSVVRSSRERFNDTKWCAGRNAKTDDTFAGKCVCEGSWGLPSCSLPKHLIKTPDKIQLLHRPRNLICAFAIRYDELELAELRIRSLAPYVDLFVVTRAFVASPLSTVSVEVNGKDALYEKFVSGWLADVQDKIIYVPPWAAAKNEKGSTSTTANSVEGNAAIFRRLAKAIATRVSDFRQDDFIIMARPEELPSTEAVATVKYHTGFTDVVGGVYSRTAFNFGAALGTVSVVPFAVSFDAFRKRFNYSFPAGIDESSTVMGSAVSPAGWSCKWCLSKDALINRVKLFTELSVVGHGGRLATLELREMVAAREKVKQIAPSSFLPEYAELYPGKYGFLLRFSSGADGPFLWPDPQPV